MGEVVEIAVVEGETDEALALVADALWHLTDADELDALLELCVNESAQEVGRHRQRVGFPIGRLRLNLMEHVYLPQLRMSQVVDSTGDAHGA